MKTRYNGKYSLVNNVLPKTANSSILLEASRKGGATAQNEVALWCALKINEEISKISNPTNI